MAKTKKDYYAILGVETNATEDQIKKAYRKLAKELHPDKTQGDEVLAEKFKSVAEAWDILSNKEKKANYDAYGDSNGQEDFDDLRSQFHSAFNGFGRGHGVIYRGEHITYTLALTLEEMFKGASKKLSYQKNTKCKSCSGNGSKFGKSFSNCSMCGGSGILYRQFGNMRIETGCGHCGGHGQFITEHCEDCGGTGAIPHDMEINVHIPAGVFAGWKSALGGYGHDSMEANGVPGDLILIIEEELHKHFERQESNIIYRLQLSFPDIVLGKKIKVPVIDGGEVAFEIPANTPAGKIFRLAGRGLPSLQHKGYVGDQLVIVGIEVPETITEEEKKLLQELQKSCNFTQK